MFLTLADPERVEPLFALIDAGRTPRPRRCSRADAARTEAIRADRAEAANRYFAGHAEVWDQIRSLHVAESEVERAIDRALGDRPLGRLVDIGTGTGPDDRAVRPARERRRSASTARRKCCAWRGSSSRRRASPSSLRQGDMYALPLADEQRRHASSSTRCSIMPTRRRPRSPRRRGCSRPAARLLVVDFAAHEREELRATRRAHPPRLRRRGDGRLVRRRRASTSTRSSIWRAAS